MAIISKTNNGLRSPVSYWGGKAGLVNDILRHAPAKSDFDLFGEAFVGGGSIFWAMQPSKIECLNDKSDFILNFYQQIKTNFAPLSAAINATLHARSTYDKCKAIFATPNEYTETERAWAFFILCNQGFVAKMETWGYERKGNAAAKFARKVDRFLPIYAERLRNVQLDCGDAVAFVKRYDYERAFFYLDPPYIGTTMSHYAAYTETDYVELLDACAKIKGKFMLSSFPTDILSEYVTENGWRQIEIRQTSPASNNKSFKTELLTMNYAAPVHNTLF